MGPDSKEDDDWTKYADTGYTSSYDPWADMVPATELEEEEFEDEFETSIPDDQAEKIQTVGQAIDFIVQATKA